MYCICKLDFAKVLSWDVVRTLSHIDHALAMLENGVAFKASGKKICYLAPNSLARRFIEAISDVRMDETGPEMARMKHLLNFKNRAVALEDFETMQQSSRIPQFGRWTSLDNSWFSQDTLRKFVSREGGFSQRVAANSRGDIMFFVNGFGPWMTLSGRIPSLCTPWSNCMELLTGTHITFSSKDFSEGRNRKLCL